MVDARRLAVGSGLLAPVLALGAVLAATALSPTFSWTASALSDTGARGEPTAVIFNGGLIAAGVVGLPFVWPLWSAAAGTLQRAGTVLLAASILGLVGVGLFPLPHPLHGPVAVGHFLSYTAGLAVHGAGSVRAGRRRWGAATAGVAVVHVLAWVGWGLLGAVADPTPLPGIAVPELVGSTALSGWLLAAAWRLRGRASWGDG